MVVEARFTLHCDDQGYTVVDLVTGCPVTLNDVPMICMSEELAQEAVELLNDLDAEDDGGMLH